MSDPDTVADPNIVADPPATISTRAELVEALGLAAEIEHVVMLQYLFAAFSLGRPGDEGFDLAREPATRRFAREVLEVTHEEMTHLAVVNQLQAVLGAAPVFHRPHLPQPPGGRRPGAPTPPTLDRSGVDGGRGAVAVRAHPGPLRGRHAGPVHAARAARGPARPHAGRGLRPRRGRARGVPLPGRSLPPDRGRVRRPGARGLRGRSGGGRRRADLGRGAPRCPGHPARARSPGAPALIRTATGIADIAAVWRARLAALRAATATGPVERAALDARIEGIRSGEGLGLFERALMSWSAELSGPVQLGTAAALPAPPVTTVPRSWRLWMGGWDADALGGFAVGEPTVPLSPLSTAAPTDDWWDRSPPPDNRPGEAP